MKLKKIRNALLVVLTLALVSATTVAITWALATKDISPVTNKFTSNPEIKLEFQEPTFDAKTWGEERTPTDSSVPTGATTNDWPTGSDAPAKPELPDGSTIDIPDNLGYNKARKYTSESIIPKNPQLRNSTNVTFTTDNYQQNGTTSDEWVALKVKYSLTVTASTFKATSGNTGTGDDKSDPILVEAFTPTGTLVFDTYDDFSHAIASVGYIPAGATAANKALDKALDDQRIGTTGDTWRDISDGKGTLFMYNRKLTTASDATRKTDTLFDCVRINEMTQKWVKSGEATPELYYVFELRGKIGESTVGVLGNSGSYQTVYMQNLPDFDISMSGYAVQGDNLYLPGTSGQTDFADDALKTFASKN